MANGKSTDPEPFVLVGSQTGITIIPAGTELTRLNYFDGKFLRAQDLQGEQTYQRTLVELSNRSGGPGVVHGLDLTLVGGDQLTLGPGMAMDPQGRVLLLPQECTVSIGDLIERSRTEIRVRKAAIAKGGAAFGECEESIKTPAPAAVLGRNCYLITIAHAEALCGREDVYGKLCEEACITSTDRPYRVEGIVLRAMGLTLGKTLGTSAAIALGRQHLRSLLASAYFADEARRGGSLISGPGLESPGWCRGAEKIGAAEMPLGVLVREGDATIFLDEWTARRERIDTCAKRHWQWRMAMRPWDVFLAQILQFQCQLHGLFRQVSAPVEDDLCSQAQRLVGEAAEHFDLLTAHYRETTAELRSLVRDAAASASSAPSERKIDFARVTDLQDRFKKISQIARFLPQDRRLIHGGIVELPSAGYLPVVPGTTISVNQQLRRFLGEGVDLRYCIVEPDFVPHALEEAQHMERISLLEGLDHPDRKPKVDVLVPNGELAPDQVEKGRYYEMRLNVSLENWKLLALAARAALSRTQAVSAEAPTPTETTIPEEGLREARRSRTAGLAPAEAQAGPDGIELDGAGRSEELTGGGVAFCYAGVSRDTAIKEVVEQPPQFAAASVGTAAPAKVKGAASRKTVARHEVAAKIPNARDLVVAGAPRQQLIEPDARASVWVSLELDRDPFALAQGASANAKGECKFLWGVTGSRAANDVIAKDKVAPQPVRQTRSVLVRANFTGQLRMEGQETRPGETQSRFTKALLAGELVVTLQDDTEQQSFGLYLSEDVEITSEGGANGPTFAVRMPEPSAVQPQVQELRMRRDWKTPAQAEVYGLIGVRVTVSRGRQVKSVNLEAVNLAATGTVTSREAFRALQTVNASVREPNHPAHESAIRALRSIGAALGNRRFADLMAARLFPPPRPSEDVLNIMATQPWVLFHRRRDKVCRKDKPASPVASRRYAFYHVQLEGIESVEELHKLLESSEGELPKFEFIQNVEFAAGIHAVQSPQKPLLANWQHVCEGSASIVGGLISSRGAAVADGSQLAQERLESLVDVLRAGSRAEPAPYCAVLSRVPDKLDTGEVDGVILAVSARNYTCQEVFWVHSTRQLQAFKRVLAKSGKVDAALLVSEAVLLGMVAFQADSTTVVNDSSAAILERWNQRTGNAPLGASLAVWTKGDVKALIYRDQANAIVKALRSNVVVQEAEASAKVSERCPAIIILVPGTEMPKVARTARFLFLNKDSRIVSTAFKSTEDANLIQDPKISVEFDADGAIRPPGGGTDMTVVVTSLKRAIAGANRKVEKVALFTGDNGPDVPVDKRLAAIGLLMKTLDLLKSGVVVEAWKLSDPKEEEAASKLLPYFETGSTVDDLIVLVLSG